MGAGASSTSSPTEIVGKIPCFSHLSKVELVELLKRFTLENYANGEAIVRQGGAGNTFYVLVKGRVGISVHNGLSEVHFGTRDVGFFFGETALLGDTNRTATVMSVAPSTMLVLTRSSFNALLKDMPALRDDMLNTVSRRLKGHLETIPMFSSVLSRLTSQTVAKQYRLLSPYELLGSLLELEQYDEKQVLFKEGDPADKFYIVMEGTVREYVRIDDPVRNRNETTLQFVRKGEFFGESSLVLGSHFRATTAKTFEPCLLLTLTQDKFQRFLDIAPGLRQPMQVAMEARTAKTMRHASILSDVPLGTMSKMARLLKFREFVEGEVIFREGDANDGMFWLVSGEVEALASAASPASSPTAAMSACSDVSDRAAEGSHAAAKALVHLNTMDPVCVIGEIAGLSGTPRTATCVARRYSVLLHLSLNDWAAFMELGSSGSVEQRIKATGSFRRRNSLEKIPTKVIPSVRTTEERLREHLDNANARIKALEDEIQVLRRKWMYCI